MVSLVRRALALFDSRTTKRFAIAVVGSTLMAFAEVLALLLVLPLMQLVSGDADSATITRIRDFLGGPSDRQLATILACGVILGFIAKSLMALTIRWWTMGFINRRMVDASADLLRYYVHAPYSLHVQRGSADFIRRLNEVLSLVFNQVMGPAVAISTEAITIIAMTAALLITAPVPTIVIGIYFGISLFVMQRLVRSRSRLAGERIVDASLQIMRYALQALRGIKEIKLRNDHELFVARYADARMVAAMEQRTVNFLAEFPKYAMETLFIIGVGLMTVLVYFNQPSDEALGVLAIFGLAGFRILPSCVRMLASVNILRSGQYALDLVEEDLAAARDFEAAPHVQHRPLPLRQSMVVEDLSFQYPDGDHPVLRGVDLDVPAGTSLALVGPSGSGKSTLVDLILGLQQPTSGRILADGVPVSEHLEEWQAGLAVVPQDVFLLDASLRENIHFTPGLHDADDEKVWHALDQAQLRDLVETLPDGLDTEVGEHGSRLSGGQRQRVGIARALFRGPHVLVLDEATSALDNETEHRIGQTMADLHGELTLVIVAHRLSTVRDCDQVAFMSDGVIAAIGTFDEVRAASPEFDRLVRLGSLSTDDDPRAALVNDDEVGVLE